MTLRVCVLPGQTSYEAAHQLQQNMVKERIADTCPDTLLFLEHKETLTVGRKRGAASNILKGDDVPVIQVERGGDVTWHGPGQLVVYPIIALQDDWADLRRYLGALETAVIALLSRLGLQARTDERNTGVWLPSPDGPPKKVCSIGIAARRWVTWHGLALNVSNDLRCFERINPCGLSAGVMTRLAAHLSPCPTLGELLKPLAEELSRALELPLEGRITTFELEAAGSLHKKAHP